MSRMVKFLNAEYFYVNNAGEVSILAERFINLDPGCE